MESNSFIHRTFSQVLNFVEQLFNNQSTFHLSRTIHLYGIPSGFSAQFFLHPNQSNLYFHSGYFLALTFVLKIPLITLVFILIIATFALTTLYIITLISVIFHPNPIPDISLITPIFILIFWSQVLIFNGTHTTLSCCYNKHICMYNQTERKGLPYFY